MPRPARKPADEPQIEGEDDANTQPLDEASPQEQSLRTGQVSQGDDDFVAALARRAGHLPKEEWKRDPNKWVDAKTYLERLPDELDSLKERNRRTAQAAADAIEDQRRQARIDAQAEIRAAAEAQDPERAETAAKRLAQVSGPPPQTVTWMGRNAWFNEDPDAQLLAVNEINRIAASGGSIEDQLEAAEAKVRRRFPEHFGQAERPEPEGEVKLSERRVSQPPAVQGGQRGGEIRTKEKGFADIPPGDRALYAKHFSRRFESSGLKPDEAQAKYARSYWANRGEA